jgi:hypothetical protein
MAKHSTLDQDADGELAAHELDAIRWVVKDVDRNKDERIDSFELRSACASGILTARELATPAPKKEADQAPKKEAE